MCNPKYSRKNQKHHTKTFKNKIQGEYKTSHECLETHKYSEEKKNQSNILTKITRKHGKKKEGRLEIGENLRPEWNGVEDLWKQHASCENIFVS